MRFLATGWLVVLSIVLSNHELAGAAPADAKPPQLRFVYFIPTDRVMAADAVERLDRVMSEVQRFYRQGMEANGYGAKTFDLERDEKGKLRLHIVQGRKAMEGYGRNSAGDVRSEVKAALAQRGIDMNSETIVVFQLLLAWHDGKATEIGPFVGGGGPLSGTAWVYDDEHLDPRLLPSKEPGGYYHRPCSWGEFNSHYIGGIAHELGHALGLPHDCEQDAQRAKLGHSLMGGGNHTYGQELRKEGRGTFLSPASAMILSRHPLFIGDRAAAREKSTCKFTDLDAGYDAGRLVLRGRITANPAAFGVIAYNDNQAIESDYDAVAWTAPVAADGTFELPVSELKPGSFEMRVRAVLQNDQSFGYRCVYTVDKSRRPDLSSFRRNGAFARAMPAYMNRDKKALEQLMAEYGSRWPGDAIVAEIGHLRDLLSPVELTAIGSIPADVTKVAVSHLAMAEERVGWGKPLRDQVPVDGESPPLIRVNGTFHAQGLYAHAPSRYALDVAHQWKTLTSAFGLQDGHPGSVVFVIVGDGRELFRSPLIKDSKLHDLKVDISKVNRLELIVEDGGDGTNSDWGVWVEPMLER